MKNHVLKNVLKDRFGWIGLILVLGVIGIVYAGCIDSEIIGFTRDDGIYTLTARALAQGQGFVLPHLPGHPAQIRYPFFYPLLLALGWLIDPVFPHNMLLLSWMTVGLTLTGLGLVYATVRWLKAGPVWLAALITLLTASNFYFVFAATSLMSEGPYLCFSVLTLLLAEGFWSRKESGEIPPTLKQIFWIILFSVITFHTRVMGLVLIVAIGTWLLSRRYWKAVGLYGLGCFLFAVLPWFGWVNTHRPPDELSLNTFVLLNPYTDYHSAFEQLFKMGTYWQQLIGSFGMFFFNFLESLFPAITTFLQVYALAWRWDKFPIAIRAFVVLQTLLSFLVPGYFLLKGISTLRKIFTERRFKSLSPSGLYVAGYLLLTLAWNFETQMARFIAMVTPWLWWWALSPLLRIADEAKIIAPSSNAGEMRDTERVQPKQAQYPIRQWAIPLATVLLLGWLTLWPGWTSLQILSQARKNHWVDGGEYPDLWQDYRAVYRYIAEKTPSQAVVATAYEMPLALYTGHPVLNLFLTNLPAMQAHNNIRHSIELLMGSLDHFKVRYLVMDPQQQDHKVQENDNTVIQQLLKRFPQRFRLVYLSPGSYVSVYEVL